MFSRLKSNNSLTLWGGEQMDPNRWYRCSLQWWCWWHLFVWAPLTSGRAVTLHILWKRTNREAQQGATSALLSVQVRHYSTVCVLQTAAHLISTPQWLLFRGGYRRAVLDWFWFQNTDKLLQQSVLSERHSFSWLWWSDGSCCHI